MESQPQNPEFRNNPENFHPCELTRLTEGLSVQIFRVSMVCNTCQNYGNINSLFLLIAGG